MLHLGRGRCTPKLTDMITPTVTKLKFCSCRQCRYGLRCKNVSFSLTKLGRSLRRKWNRLAREGRDEEIASASVPYTD